MIYIQLAVVLCSTLTHGASDNLPSVQTQRAANSNQYESYEFENGKTHTREILYSKTGNRVPVPPGARYVNVDPLALPPDFDRKTSMQKGYDLQRQRKSLQIRERILRNEDADLEKSIHSYYFSENKFNKDRYKEKSQEAEAKQNDVCEQLEAVLGAQKVNKSLIEKLQTNKVQMPPMIDYKLPTQFKEFQKQSEKLRKLGSGECGEVFEYKYTVPKKGKKGSEKNYAVKRVKKVSEAYALEKRACDFHIRASPLLAGFSELDWHDKEKVEKAKVSQRFINTIVKTYDEEDFYFFIVLELGDGENFSELTRVDGELHRLDEENAKFYAACLLRAIEITHTKHIAHRDIKPANMVINPESGYLQLTDFGLAVESKGENLNEPCGAIGYMAPEQIRSTKYGKDVDWWAYGVTLYRLCTGRNPFSVTSEKISEKETLKGLTERHETELKVSQWSDDGKDLIRRLLLVKPTQRLNNDLKVRDHPWFKDFNWDLLDSGRFPAPWKPSKHLTGGARKVAKTLEQTKQDDNPMSQEDLNEYYEMGDLQAKHDACMDNADEEF